MGRDSFVVRFEAKIAQCITMLSVNPFIYQNVNEEMEVRRCVLHKNCAMFYKVQNDEVLIIYFADNRQDPFFLL